MCAASIQAAARLLADAEHAIALTGAGMSAESGIPPFRGADGLWTNHSPPHNLSYREFIRDPQRWWQRRLYDEATPDAAVYRLKAAADRAAPHPGHFALARLERIQVLCAVITQNVDGLHSYAGSRTLLELHGNRNYLRCIACGSRRPRDDYTGPLLPPLCTCCGGILKLDTVLFGEPIPAATLAASLEQVSRCDVLLLVGTSGMVNPAAQFPLLASERGARIIEVNPQPTRLTPLAHLAISGPAGALLPQIAAAVSSCRDGTDGPHPPASAL